MHPFLETSPQYMPPSREKYVFFLCGFVKYRVASSVFFCYNSYRYVNIPENWNFLVILFFP